MMIKSKSIDNIVSLGDYPYMISMKLEEILASRVRLTSCNWWR